MNKIKLNLGSGPGKIIDPTWQHYDASKRLLLLKKIPFIGYLKINHSTINERKWDLNTHYKDIKKLSFRRESVDFIYSSHTLEHLYLGEAKILLEKTYRWLKPGGIIRLALPDYDQIHDEFNRSRETNPLTAYEKYADRLGSHPFKSPGGALKVLISELIGKPLHTHKWHPHADYVIALLTSFGFSHVQLQKHKASLIPHIELIETREKDTFFVDAVK
jgi:SAM-dependent methyltransferase